MNKKAFGAVVAISILIVVVVVAVLSFQVWFQNYSSSIFIKAEKIDKQQINIETIIGNNLYLKNIGDENLSVNSIKIGKNYCNISINISSGITPINLEDCLKNLTESVDEIVIVTDNFVSRKIFNFEKNINSFNSPQEQEVIIECNHSGTNGFYSGTGTDLDPYQICDCRQLHNVSLGLTSSYILINNIDCSETKTWNEGEGFDLISGFFSGNFDGKNNSIRNLYIFRNESNYIGLFTQLNGGTIKNLDLENVNVTGKGRVGSLVGHMYSGLIDNVNINGIVYGNEFYVGGIVGISTGGVLNFSSFKGIINSSSSYLGGLLGSNVALINNSYFEGSIFGGENLGGLVGFSNTNGNISNSYAIGNISSSGSLVGGLTGYSGNNNIKNSYFKGNVNGTKKVGGLVGNLGYGGTIINSYSIGNISGSETYTFAGGLVGIVNYDNANILNSYSVGVVSGDQSVGGLVGSNIGTINNSYYDTNVSGRTDTGRGEPKTTLEMQDISTYNEWDIEAVSGGNNEAYSWNIEDGLNYPFLSWE